MPVWLITIFAIIFLIIGIISFRNKTKAGEDVWTFSYIGWFVLCFACVLYIITTFLLLGGIE
jgi:uncharacterized membrane protein YdjX (TVP38/TMEM64 family)